MLKMSVISSVKAKQISDSLGRATIEITLTTDDGDFVDSVPAGTSVGAAEAKTVSATQAVSNVIGPIAKAIIGKNPIDQQEIDKILKDLDGAPDKSKLGANSVLPVSLACARAGAASQKLELFQWLGNLSGLPRANPVPMMVMISGGAHGHGNLINIQEFMVVGPTSEGNRVWRAIERELLDKKIPWDLDEGAFAPKLIDDSGAIELLNSHRQEMGIAIDVAASHRHSVIDMVSWIDKYPLVSIEDPFDQEDWPIWQKFTADFGNRLLVVGDDLFTTNPRRVERGIKEKSANAIVVKPNQIGTLTEVFEVCRLAHKAGWTIIVSHRSGETEDDFIADLSVAVGAHYLKSGAPQSKERKTKYNRLAQILR